MRRLSAKWPAGAFPVSIFILYMISYSGQAVYGTYLNLYLAARGFSQSQIGLTVSVSTIFVMLFQMLWGAISDRAKSKNTVICGLYLLSAGIILLYYTSVNFWIVLAVLALYASVYTGVSPLMDNVILELSEGQAWNFGQIRTGGTIGYCLAVLLTGFVIGENYERIFAITSAALLCCFFLMRRVPRVAGRRPGPERSSVRVLLKNKPLMVVMAYYLAFSMGLSLFYSFYPIHFTSIGGTSAQVGIMLFFCAVTEIPCLMLARRVVKRIGLDRVLILSGLVTVIRWVLLFLLKSPYAAIFANLLHGVGYTGFTYCVVVYINEHVPKDLRATGQSFNVLVGHVSSRVIFGYLGGLASQAFGVHWVMLMAGMVLAAATLLFGTWSSRHHEEFA